MRSVDRMGGVTGMNCPTCGATSSAGAHFCSECGTALHGRCAACGAEVGAHQNFCSACGRPVSTPDVSAVAPHRLAGPLASAPGGLRGERKQVTVMFADLKSSLELLGDLDPEEAQKLLDPVVAVMVASVRRYGGTVNQIMGDGIMALFGAPIAQEDHAVRACHAALEVHAALARHAAAVRRESTFDLRVRIGLNSGEVLVHLVDSDLRFEYTAVGRTTHVAARMEQLAVPGTTLLTATTRRLAEGYVDVRPMGPVVVRGLAAPMDVYELVGTAPERPRFEVARARWTTPFVGRRPEVFGLRQCAERAGAGRGQVVAVVGEPGIGKSRLVGEFTRAHLPSGWSVFETGAIPYAPTTAFLPIIGLLRRYFDVGEGDDLSVIRDKVATRILGLADAPMHVLPPLLDLLGVPVEDPAWEAIEPARRRQYTLDAVSEVLVRHSRTQPVALVVEDLQDLDAETQGLLDCLVDRAVGERLLVLVTYRPEYVHSWSGRGHYTQLAVQPLSTADAQHLLEDLLGVQPDLGGLVALLVERSDGNPLFLEASVSDLVEARALVGEPGSYHLEQPITAVVVPTTVQAVLAARMDRLPEESRSVLQCAAVIGKDVSVPVLAAVASLDEEEARRRLRDLVARGFLYESTLFPAPQYSFAHVVTLEVAIGSLVKERLRALDLKILDALERLHPGRLSEHVERLAHHAVRGEAWERAVRYCREAGGRALARSAHRAAVEYFERALAALEHLPESTATMTEAIDIRLDLRAALIPMGEYRRTVDYLQEAERLTRTMGDERRLATIGSHLANYLHLTGALAGAAERARHTLAIAERLGDVELQVVTTAYLAFAHHTAGAYPDAAELARRNVALLRGALGRERFGMTSLPAVYSRTCLAWSLAEMGDFDEADAVADEALALAEEEDHSYSVVYACLAAGVSRLRRGNFEGAGAVLQRGLDLCHSLGIRVLVSMVAVPLAGAFGHCGRIADALRILEDSAARARHIRDPIGHWVRTGALAETYALAGRVAEAHPLAVQYLEQRRAIGARGYEAWGLHLLADVTARLGSSMQEEARTRYLEAIALGERLGMRPLVALCRLGLGRIDLELGRPIEGRASLVAALESFRSMRMPTWVARSEHALHGP